MEGTTRKYYLFSIYSEHLNIKCFSELFRCQQKEAVIVFGNSLVGLSGSMKPGMKNASSQLMYKYRLK